MTLATFMARRTLETAGTKRFTGAIARANQWLRATKPANILDMATVVLAVPGRRELLKPIVAAQTSDGGWGPQPGAPAEPFDTALVLLALKDSEKPKQLREGARFSRRFSNGTEVGRRPPGRPVRSVMRSTSPLRDGCYTRYCISGAGRNATPAPYSGTAPVRK